MFEENMWTLETTTCWALVYVVLPSSVNRG